VEQTPERSHAARVEALLRQAGVRVRVISGEPTAGELEVQVPVAQLQRAIAELEELDRLDDDEEEYSPGSS
jgi:hypothetical protein